MMKFGGYWNSSHLDIHHLCYDGQAAPFLALSFMHQALHRMFFHQMRFHKTCARCVFNAYGTFERLNMEGGLVHLVAQLFSLEKTPQNHFTCIYGGSLATLVELNEHATVMHNL